MPSVFVKIEVIMAVIMQINVLWVVKLGSLVYISRFFRHI